MSKFSNYALTALPEPVLDGSNPIEIAIHGEPVKSGGSKPLRFDPNTLTIAVFNKDFIKILREKLGSPVYASELSGRPAYVYEVADGFNGRRPRRTLRLRLTPYELKRMMQLALRPEEYLALFRRYGVFFEIHDDFYFEDGEAVQPHVRVR